MANTKVIEVTYKFHCIGCHTDMVANNTIPIKQGIIILSCPIETCREFGKDYAVNMPIIVGTEVDTTKIQYDQVMDKAKAAGATLGWKAHEYRAGGWYKIPEPVKTEVLPTVKEEEVVEKSKRTRKRTS